MQFMLAGEKTLMMPLQPPAARTGLPVSLSQLQAVLVSQSLTLGLSPHSLNTHV